MSDLLREVDDIMRQERMAKIWNEYGLYIIGFVIGVIVLTACVSGYKTWNISVREAQTAQVLAFQEASDYPQNVLALEKANLRGGLKGVLYMSAAGMFVSQDKEDEALTLYERTAADENIPAEFSHLAELMIVRLAMDKDDADSALLLERVARVYEDKKSPWAYYARLEAALIYAHLEKNYTAARAQLAVILSASGTPSSLVERAEALDHVYGLKEQEGRKNG